MKRLDLFGSQIMFRFEGKSSNKTLFGSTLSVIIAAIIIIRLVFIIIEVWERKSPQVIYSERQVSSPLPFEFNNSTATFAFGMQDAINAAHFIDPSIYTLTIMKTKKSSFFNSTSKEKEVMYESVYIVPKPCTEQSFSSSSQEAQEFFLTQNYKDLYCIDSTDSLIIEGDYSSDVFQYFTFKITRCEGGSCADSGKIDEMLKNGYFAIYYTDILVDQENKDQPFKKFVRDMYWIVNEAAPKNVNFFFRNTYVESDFGWFYEDTQTQRFAQFSNADVQYMPTGSADYYFALLFRFEKQKENVHKRKYKNVNSIISEIGGFAQTLMAIGFLFCTRLSELELNKEIINQAFSFDNSSSSEDQNEPVKLSKDPPPISPLPSAAADSLHIPLPKYQNQEKILEHTQNSKLQNSSQHNSNINKNPILKQLEQHQLQQNTHNKSKEQQTHFAPKLQSLPSAEEIQLSQIIKQKTLHAPISAFASPIQTPLSPSVEPNTEKADQGDSNQKQPEMTNQEFKKILSRYTSSMTLNVWEYLKYFVWPFGRIKEKKQIIDYSIDKLYYHLDLLNIVKKLLEVDKLKRLLMDDDQLRLFEFLPKPLIRTEEVLAQNNRKQSQQAPNDIHTNMLYQDTRSDIEKTQQAFSSFVRVSQKQHLLPFDEKILAFMDKKVLSLFEANMSVERNSQEPIQNKTIQQQQSIKDQQTESNLKSPTLLESRGNLLKDIPQQFFSSNSGQTKELFGKSNQLDEISGYDEVDFDFENQIQIEINSDEGGQFSRNPVKTKGFPQSFFKK